MGIENRLLIRALAGLIFFSPNFLFFLSFIQKNYWIMMLINFFVIFILVSSVDKLKSNNSTLE